ncbi:MAG: exodeoxyribonuclease VII large subunit [Planctomycetia bacterium]|nr:exodeoxyribonuclease VII large subunit [Planctomycetia bacterium]
MSQPYEEPIDAEDPTQEAVWSVGELTLHLKDLLETSFPAVWVSGEISNFSRPSSGHCYFTLKDEQAQIRAVMWRGTATRLKFDLHDGLEVVCFGGVDVYAPRGSYQLVVSKLEPKGIGALELALRKLKEKLAAEGLFDHERKRPLPTFPRRIAFVTSPTGAAVRDFLEVLRRRWNGADVIVVPTRVQGEGAAAEIAAAIAKVNRLPLGVDVLVVGRGGGSLEDLWCFNEEAVVRAVAGSRIPVVSAVGHEIDVTLGALAADVRALTPSEAAELVVPSQQAIQAAVDERQRRLVAALRNKAVAARQRLTQLSQRRVFRAPTEWIRDRAQRLDELGLRSGRAMKHRLQIQRGKLDGWAGKLESLSPLGVLARGYSVTQRAADGTLVRDAAQLQPGELIRTRLADGELLSRVEQVET